LYKPLRAFCDGGARNSVEKNSGEKNCGENQAARVRADESVRNASGGMMVSQSDIQFYRDCGYLVVENVVSASELAVLRSELKGIVQGASVVTESNHIYDLEDSHTADKPRVRRIKEPHKVMPSVQALMKQPALLSIVKSLIGPGVRFQTAKLNMKAAGFGAAVEWHQDWAFYPHTNDDLLAVGVMLDDVDEINGPMQVIPGSHKGKIFNHHADGYFCGAIDPSDPDVDFESAVSLKGKAGAVTFHHVRSIHGSALNRSDRSRNFLLYQFTANDAWPLIERVRDMAAYNSNIVAGAPTLEPRLTDVPVRIPLSQAPDQGSIYENQRTLKNRFFDVHTSPDSARESL